MCQNINLVSEKIIDCIEVSLYSLSTNAYNLQKWSFDEKKKITLNYVSAADEL